MEDILSALGWFIIEVVVLKTGRAVVRVVSLGQWRGEDSSGNEGRIHGPAGALSFQRDGTRVVTRTGLLFVGLAFYFVAAVACLALLGR